MRLLCFFRWMKHRKADPKDPQFRTYTSTGAKIRHLPEDMLLSLIGIYIPPVLFLHSLLHIPHGSTLCRFQDHAVRSVVSKIIPDPVKKNKKLVSDSQYRHKVNAHPQEPGEKSREMKSVNISHSFVWRLEEKPCFTLDATYQRQRVTWIWDKRLSP